MSAVLKYSLLRLALFGVCAAVLVVVRVPVFLAVVFAAVISAALSYLFLHRQRDQVVSVIEARVAARSAAHRPADEDDEDAEAGSR